MSDTAPPPTDPAQPQVQHAQEPRNGLGIAALCLGIVGCLFGLIPLTGFIALILGAIGLILGLSARGRLKSGRADNKKMTWAGVILSVVSLALGIWGMVILFTAVDQFGEDMEKIGQDLDEYSKCIEKADTPDQMADCE